MNREDMFDVMKGSPRGSFQAICTTKEADELMSAAEEKKISIEELRMHSIYAPANVRNHILEGIWRFPYLRKAWFLNDIYTVTEAAEEWGFKSTGNIRQACIDGKFEAHEVRKSGKNWIITREGMLRVFGEPKREGLTE